MVDVLAVGAHPDDIELTCGGTLAMLSGAGRKTAILDLTQGELGTRGTKEIRLREADDAARILGVAVRRTLDIPDGNIELSVENRLKVISVIRELRPSLLLIPHEHERHPDHVRAHHLAREAWFSAGLKNVKSVRDGNEQPPHRPHAYFEFMQWYEFSPSFIVDVSDVHEKKMKAVRAFRSQFYNPESGEPKTKLSEPGFLEMIEVRSRAYGEKIGVRHGEPFFSLYPVGVKNLFDVVTVQG